MLQRNVVARGVWPILWKGCSVILTTLQVMMQARVEEVWQALLRRTQDAGGLGPRRKGKRSRFHMDAYEEHMLLPEVLLRLQPSPTAMLDLIVCSSLLSGSKDKPILPFSMLRHLVSIDSIAKLMHPGFSACCCTLCSVWTAV